MGIIQKQSIRSTFLIIIGFAVGAVNLILIAPKVLTPEQLGLTRIITDAGVTMATLCTLGSLPIINKFFPIFSRFQKPEKNELPFITLTVCLIGFVIVCIVGYLLKDIIVRKFSERSPLFVHYSYLVYPFCFFMLLFVWLESFAWSLKKGVISIGAKETAPRIIFTILLALIAYGLINTDTFFILFSLSFLLPVIIVFISLRKTGKLHFYPHISTSTIRLKDKMMSFGLFLFGAQFLNILSKTVDTFILSAKSSRGLTDAAVFTIATYVVTLMDIPQRSINSISIPVLAESWRNKNLKNIIHIYKRSVSNLLVIGLFIFPLLWLNIHTLSSYLGSDYADIEKIVLFMGVAKLIDLGTGANAQIIATSNFWKVDFTTNVIYTLLALPLNYILISNYGLMGAAYSSLIALTFYNAMRYFFLWYKFKLQPYNYKNLIALLIGMTATAVAYFIPVQNPAALDIIVRSTVFIIIFIPAIYFFKVSEELNVMADKFVKGTKSFFKI
jgi:O-antigen/teichoic acid export membrane protein